MNRITTGLAITLVVAVGQVLVVLTRNIDLSVSSTVGLSAYIVGTQLTHHNDLPIALAPKQNIEIPQGRNLSENPRLDTLHGRPGA